jgi:hypothetical protein
VSHGSGRAYFICLLHISRQKGLHRFATERRTWKSFSSAVAYSGYPSLDTLRSLYSLYRLKSLHVLKDEVAAARGASHSTLKAKERRGKSLSPFHGHPALSSPLSGSPLATDDDYTVPNITFHPHFSHTYILIRDKGFPKEPNASWERTRRRRRIRGR